MLCTYYGAAERRGSNKHEFNVTEWVSNRWSYSVNKSKHKLFFVCSSPPQSTRSLDDGFSGWCLIQCKNGMVGNNLFYSRGVGRGHSSSQHLKVRTKLLQLIHCSAVMVIFQQVEIVHLLALEFMTNYLTKSIDRQKNSWSKKEKRNE